jgi:lipopolysaccharide biosynthesis glycosyltransferase
MKYPICCATDEGYAQHCAVMLCSLFENNKGKNFIIHILTSGLSDKIQWRLIDMVQSYHSECIFHQVKDHNFKEIRGVTNQKKFVKLYHLL